MLTGNVVTIRMQTLAQLWLQHHTMSWRGLIKTTTCKPHTPRCELQTHNVLIMLCSRNGSTCMLPGILITWPRLPNSTHSPRSYSQEFCAPPVTLCVISGCCTVCLTTCIVRACSTWSSMGGEKQRVVLSFPLQIRLTWFTAIFRSTPRKA